MSINWVHRTMIVPTAYLTAAQNLCAGLAGISGTQMFLCALGNTPTGEQTHGMSTGFISDQFAILLPLWQRVVEDDKEIWNKVSNGQASVIVALAQAQQIELSLAEVSALLAAVWVSDVDWVNSCQYLNLVPIKSEEILI